VPLVRFGAFLQEPLADLLVRLRARIHHNMT
jgi:hypothetical protein